jgi:hypothetical protein
MESTGFFKMLVTVYKTSLHNIAEESILDRIHFVGPFMMISLSGLHGWIDGLETIQKEAIMTC